MSAKRAIVYARVPTTHQNVDNQLLELRQNAERFGWQVVSELVDDGISGAKDEATDQHLIVCSRWFNGVNAMW